MTAGQAAGKPPAQDQISRAFSIMNPPAQPGVERARARARDADPRPPTWPWAGHHGGPRGVHGGSSANRAVARRPTRTRVARNGPLRVCMHATYPRRYDAPAVWLRRSLTGARGAKVVRVRVGLGKLSGGRCRARPDGRSGEVIRACCGSLAVRIRSAGLRPDGLKRTQTLSGRHRRFPLPHRQSRCGTGDR